MLYDKCMHNKRKFTSLTLRFLRDFLHDVEVLSEQKEVHHVLGGGPLDILGEVVDDVSKAVDYSFALLGDSQTR